MNWEDLRLFIAVARSGTMRAASNACGLSPATLSRRIADLELSLGATVFERNTAGCVPTAFGTTVLSAATKMQKIAGEIANAAQLAKNDASSGTVRIHACEWASYLLMRLIGSFQSRLPGISIEVITAAATPDIACGGADIGLQTARPTDESLYVRRIGKLRFGLYCSRDYYLRHCDAFKAGNLADLAFVQLVHRDSEISPPLIFDSLSGGSRKPALISNSAMGVIASVTGGSGLGVMAQQAAPVELVNVNRHITHLDDDLWLVQHAGSRDVPRVRMVVELLEEIFQ